jgi:hypothetical protein
MTEIDVRSAVNLDQVRIRFADNLYLTGTKDDPRLALMQDGNASPLLRIPKAQVDAFGAALLMAMRVW